jgi:hypothetical protein
MIPLFWLALGLGIITGATVVTGLWIRNLLRIIKHNAQVWKELLER